MAENSSRADIEFMLKQFKPERFAYLSVCIASFLLLLVCIIVFMMENEMSQKNIGLIAGMVGSGGAIAYTTSQLLRMWRDCMELISRLPNKTD